MKLGEIALKIREKRCALTALETDLDLLAKQRDELLAKVEVEESEEELNKLEGELNGVAEQIGKKEQEKIDLDGEVEKLQSDLDTAKEKQERAKSLGGDNKMNEKDIEQRDALNAFIRTKGQSRAGIISGEVGAVIPESISYNPELEVKTVTNLGDLVTKTKVTTASGKYPILEKATARLNTVAELEKNPELAKPKFTDVAWEVETYRGAIPISQESIDDSAVDLTEIVARGAKEQKINTVNYKVSEVLKSFTAKEIADADGLKQILNVALDPAYNAAIIASQSFFHALDTLKDGNGRYLLQDDVTSPSGKRVFGKQVVVIEDTLFGVAGDAKAFVGDLKRAVLFADRKDLEVRWADNDIYGKYLQAVLRLDVKQADKKAGYFVTYKAKPKV